MELSQNFTSTLAQIDTIMQLTLIIMVTIINVFMLQ